MDRNLGNRGLENQIMIKKLYLLFFAILFSLPIAVSAQTNVSASSYKHSTLATQSITSAAVGTGVDTTGFSYLMVQYKGTYTANATTAGFQVSLDGGTTYIDQAFWLQGIVNTCLYQTATGALSANSTNVWAVPIAGYNRFRTNALNWASGTINVTIIGASSAGGPCNQVSNFPAISSTIDSIAVVGPSADGAAVSGAPVRMAGKDGGGSTQDVLTDTSGNQQIVGSGTAGAAAGGILTIQGVASMVKVLTTPDSVALPPNQSVNANQVAGTATDVNSGNKSAGTQRNVLATDSPSIANYGHGTLGSAVPAVGVFQGLSDGTNLRGWLNAANALNSTGAGIGTAQAIGQFDDTSPQVITENQFGNLRVSQNRNLYNTIRDAAGNERGVNVNSSNQLSVSVDNSNVSSNEAQINGVTPLMGNGVSGTGAQRVAIVSDNTANSNPWLAQAVAGTANGLSMSALQSAASTNATNIKASAGNLYHIHAINTTATLYYLRLYNLSSAPTCSSATGFIMTIPIPASTAGAGVVIDSALGFTFGTGIGFCFTGGGTSTDNTNAATGVFVNFGYK